MMSSLYISVCGMKAFTEKIGVTSNNIANVETTGFKSSTVHFSDMLTESIAKSYGSNSGSGVEVQSSNEVWVQGTITGTDNATDLAVNGSGFFVVQAGDGSYYYTRDGSFEFDDEGNLLSGTGYNVQGYAIDENGNLGTLQNIQVSYNTSAPSATTEMSTTVTLNSGAEDGDTFTTTTPVHDSLGNEIPITITYTKTANANEWTYEADISSEYGTLGGDSAGTLTFDSDGNLTSGTNPSFDLTLTNGGSNQSITWNLYDDSGDTTGALTQYSAESTLLDQSQDGYAAGTLSGIAIDEAGYVKATYSNGEKVNLFQIALADFNCYTGLAKTDGNYYRATNESGEAILGTSGSGNFGKIATSALESSRVDLATEMSDLITAQAAYQANSKVFSITNEMLEVLVNLT